jgi:nitric oxide reductase large subunit
LIAEITIATDTATANWRNSWPEMPGMKAVGTNTDSSTSVMAMIGAVICPSPSWSPRPA